MIAEFFLISSLALACAYYLPSLYAGLRRNDYLNAAILSRTSMVMYSTYAAYYAVCLYQFTSANYPLINVTGLILASIGVALHFASIMQLSDSYSAHERSDYAQLKTKGLYAIVRHPIYSAAIIYFLGLSLALLSPASILMLAIVLAYLHWRISVEEKGLEKKFGKKYEDYEKKVPSTIIALIAAKLLAKRA